MDDQRAGIRLAQLRLYVDNHVFDKYLAPPLTLITAGLLTFWVPLWQAVLWGTLELLVIANYIRVYHQFRAARVEPRDEALWVKRIAIAHGAHMLLWSSIVVWAWERGNFPSMVFTMLVHIGLISLTAAMSNPHLRLLILDMVFPTLALLAPPLLEMGWRNFGLALLGLFYTVLMTLVGRQMHASISEALHLRVSNENLIRELERQASRDSLTGVPNRRHFLESANQELAVAREAGTSLALLMVDIDHFKPINDRFGHLAGDEVICAIAQACQANLRAGDCLGRLGGEEFALVLPGTNLAESLEAAERLRLAVAALAVPLDGETVRPTVSIGVALREPADTSLSALLHRADLAMYEAKTRGRNRVVGPGWAAENEATQPANGAVSAPEAVARA